MSPPFRLVGDLQNGFRRISAIAVAADGPNPLVLEGVDPEHLELE
jgi:hypothetical protein